MLTRIAASNNASEEEDWPSRMWRGREKRRILSSSPPLSEPSVTPLFRFVFFDAHPTNVYGSGSDRIGIPLGASWLQMAVARARLATAGRRHRYRDKARTRGEEAERRYERDDIVFG
ncbi:hypothetical protein KM043_008158 [Ampulex compressa]|nr:hypothetical protein KM043_008158 [Ampulex compressa]